MRKVTVHEAKTHLSRLLREVEAGEEIIICRGDVEVARMVAANGRARGVGEQPMAKFEHGATPLTPKQKAMGYLKGKIDPVTDEQALAPAWGEEEWAAVYAKWARHDAADADDDEPPGAAGA